MIMIIELQIYPMFLIYFTSWMKIKTRNVLELFKTELKNVNALNYKIIFKKKSVDYEKYIYWACERYINMTCTLIHLKLPIGIY